MTEQEDARAAAVAAGCHDLVEGEITKDGRGFLLPRRNGYHLLVSEPFEPGLDLRAVYLDTQSDAMTRRPTIVATIPGTGQVPLTSPTAFTAFARWACTRLAPARLAELLVQQLGPPGATVLVVDGDEAEGLSTQVPQVHRFLPRNLPDGGWHAHTFTSFTYQRAIDGELRATFLDWEASITPTSATWHSHKRTEIAVG